MRRLSKHVYRLRLNAKGLECDGKLLVYMELKMAKSWHFSTWLCIFIRNCHCELKIFLGPWGTSDLISMVSSIL